MTRMGDNLPDVEQLIALRDHLNMQLSLFLTDPADTDWQNGFLSCALEIAKRIGCQHTIITLVEERGFKLQTLTPNNDNVPRFKLTKDSTIRDLDVGDHT